MNEKLLIFPLIEAKRFQLGTVVLPRAGYSNNNSNTRCYETMLRLYLAAVVQEDNLSLENAAASRCRRVVATVGEGATSGCDVTDASERIVGGVRLLIIEAADEAATAAHRLGQRVEHLAHRREDL